MSKTQTRGNCQRCGRQQAVRGAVAKHGYTVEHGYLEGVCTGHLFAPLQVERAEADRVILACREDAPRLMKRAADLEAGLVFPARASAGTRSRVSQFVWADDTVPFAEATLRHQREAVASEKYRCESRARAALAFADDLEKLADQLHGTDLVVVQLAPAAARVQEGERRVCASGVLVARYQDGARVYWTRAKDGFRGWSGTQAWRGFEVAP